MKKSKMIIILILLFFISLVILKLLIIKNSIESSKQTIIYDRKGFPIIERPNQNLSLHQLPQLTLNYIDTEKEYKNLPKMLFSINTFDYRIAQILINHFYKDSELKKYYLNHLYFQNGIIGFNTAAKYYFNKEVHELSGIETIFLMSKTKTYSSNSNTKTNLTFFIHDLYKKRLISKTEEVMYTKKIPDLQDSLYNKNTVAQSYVDYVIYELKTNLKMNEDDLFRKGYSIYTNLDSKIQLTMQANLQDITINSEKEVNAPIETGIAIIEQRTGGIVGLAGGRKYQQDDLNRSYQIKRQPASTFKPLIVFAPAIELGWKPTDMLIDKPMTFGTFKPQNYDFTFRGEVSLQDTVINSYNVPTTWLLSKIGLDSGLSYINKFDLFRINKKDGYALANGFTSIGTSPLALAQAYSSFPNGGMLVKSHAVQKVVNSLGITVYKAKHEEKKIFSKKTARIITDLLHNVVEEGTGEKAKIPDQFIAGKTGTTSYDLWFVGFNRNYVGAIWMGPDEVKPQNRININGGDSPSTLFKKIFVSLD